MYMVYSHTFEKYLEIWKPLYFCNQSDTHGFYMDFHDFPSKSNLQ